MCFISFSGKSVWGRAGSAEHDQMNMGNFLRHTKNQQLVCSLGFAAEAIRAHVARLN